MADSDELDEAALLEEAMECYQRGDHPRAIALCTRLIALDPSWAQPFYFRGASRLAQGDAAGAVADLSQTLALEPDSPYFVYHDRGRALGHLGRHEEALADFEHALRLKPDSASTFNRMGTTLYQLDRVNEALAAYSEAVRLAPERADYHYDRGACQLECGQIDEAVADFTHAIEREPDSHYFFSRGTAYLRRGDHEKALADLDQAVALEPGNARAWYARGYVLFQTRRREEAEADFARAVELRSALEGWPYEQRWLQEQRVRARGHLRSRGVSAGGFPEEPAWHLAPYLALWRVPQGKGVLWVIAGDCPSDHLAGAESGARAALRAFGLRWQRAAGNLLAGHADPEVDVGPPENWSELGALLRTRAELLLDFAGRDELWGDTPGGG